jgi:prepilin-type N-terminal cleavage/methylation domain-containing protein
MSGLVVSSIPRTEQGFTIIELLIGLAMTGVIFGAVCSFLIVQRRTHAAQEQTTHMVQRARAAMDLMGYELQMAGYNPRRVAFEGISYHTSQLEFRADLNGNGTTAEAEETINYTYDATQRRLLRDAGTGVEPLSDHIQAFMWEYLDANGTPTTAAANIRQIRLAITTRTAKSDPLYQSNGGYRTYTLTSVITPRNLAYR